MKILTKTSRDYSSRQRSAREISSEFQYELPCATTHQKHARSAERGVSLVECLLLVSLITLIAIVAVPGVTTGILRSNCALLVGMDNKDIAPVYQGFHFNLLDKRCYRDPDLDPWLGFYW